MKKQIKQEKVLLVAGCSHSCGSEIEEAGLAESEYNVNNSYGGVLATELNLKHYNIASSNNSNKIIISNVVHHIHLLLKSYNPKDIFVIVGWTGFARYEVVHKEVLHRWTFNSDKNRWWHNRPKEIQDYHRIWQKFVNQNMLCNNHVLNYVLLKNFLDHQKINYFFFNAVHSLDYADKDYLQFHDDQNIDQIGYEMIKNDERYYFPFEESKTFFHTLKEKFDPFEDGRWYHFKEDGHHAWAEIIKPFIQYR